MAIRHQGDRQIGDSNSLHFWLPLPVLSCHRLRHTGILVVKVAKFGFRVGRFVTMSTVHKFTVSLPVSQSRWQGQAIDLPIPSLSLWSQSRKSLHTLPAYSTDWAIWMWCTDRILSSNRILYLRLWLWKWNRTWWNFSRVHCPRPGPIPLRYPRLTTDVRERGNLPNAFESICDLVMWSMEKKVGRNLPLSLPHNDKRQYFTRENATRFKTTPPMSFEWRVECADTVITVNIRMIYFIQCFHCNLNERVHRKESEFPFLENLE